MEVIMYNFDDDQFWIACNEEEINHIFLPMLSEIHTKHYHKIIQQNKTQDKEYWEMIMKTTGTEEKYHCYFNVSRDLKTCFPTQQPYYPFANLWNGYSTFEKMKIKTIHSLSELKYL